jgi:hypothetical protein
MQLAAEGLAQAAAAPWAVAAAAQRQHGGVLRHHVGVGVHVVLGHQPPPEGGGRERQVAHWHDGACGWAMACLYVSAGRQCTCSNRRAVYIVRGIGRAPQKAGAQHAWPRGCLWGMPKGRARARDGFTAGFSGRLPAEKEKKMAVSFKGWFEPITWRVARPRKRGGSTIRVPPQNNTSSPPWLSLGLNRSSEWGPG